MNSSVATVQQSYIDLRALNLGTAFVRDEGLVPGQKYTMLIEGLPDVQVEGTLCRSGLIGGLAILYRHFALDVRDKIMLDYDGSVIRLVPPREKLRAAEAQPSPLDQGDAERQPVFEAKHLKHIHIEPYAPGNLASWIPQTEADVYMAFGALSEYTDYRYCCGASQALLNRLGYTAKTKPDAILIERATGQYLIAEFKMDSKDFSSNHSKDDVDILICWDDSVEDRNGLPREVLSLKSLLERAIKEGEVDL